MRTIATLSVVMMVAAIAGSARADAGFEVLPAAPLFSGWALARGVSGNGEVVVGSGSVITTERAYYWRRMHGAWTQFELPVTGRPEGRAIAASSTGDTIIGMSDAYSGYSLAYGTPTVWRGVLSGSPVADSPMDQIGSPVFSGIFCGVDGIGGRVAGWATPHPGGVVSEIWMYEAAALARLSPFPTDVSFTGPGRYGNCLSGDGSVMVGSMYKQSENRRRAFRWSTGEGFAVLPAEYSAALHGRAEAVSGDGLVIGGYLSPSGASSTRAGQPVVWTAAGLTMLPLPPDGGEFGRVCGLSFDGGVACGFQHDGDLTGGYEEFAGSRAVIWLSGQVHQLDHYLLSRGVDLAGVVPAWACGVSSDGQIIVGIATRPASQDVVPFVASLGPSCRADLNGDGVVDFADYLEFLNLFEALSPAVDFNQDGVIDFGDYLAFLNYYDAGC